MARCHSEEPHQPPTFLIFDPSHSFSAAVRHKNHAVMGTKGRIAVTCIKKIAKFVVGTNRSITALASANGTHAAVGSSTASRWKSFTETPVAFERQRGM